jgi:hypothetical protein
MNKKNDDINNVNNNNDIDDFDDECGCNLCYTTRIVGQFLMDLIPNNKYFRNPFMFCFYIILFLVGCFLFFELLLVIFIKLFIN